jgi:hypothetical protein
MQIGGSSGVLLSRDIPFGWANDVNDPSQQGSNDLIIRRDAANTFAQRNSTNAQTFRLYNTYTDASNYERGFFRWSSNVLEIGAEAAGTGTKRVLRIVGPSLASAESVSALEVNQTWNTTGTPSAIKLDVTNTASNSASLLMQLQTGGTNRFTVSHDGIGTFAGRISCGGSIAFLANSVIESPTDETYNFRRGLSGSVRVQIGVGYVRIGDSGSLEFNSSSASSASDLSIIRDAANILAQRRTTNAQTFRLYRTYTDASNYERLGFLTTNTTRYTITSENAGTGSARSLEVSFYTAASDPTSTDITSGCFSVWKNSGTGTIKLWANDGGTMKSVALA